MKTTKWFITAVAVALTSGLLVGCASPGSQARTTAEVQAKDSEGTAAQVDVSETGDTETGDTEAGLKQAVSSGGDLLAQIQEKGVITIGTEGTYSPNSYHDENGKLVGFDVEVAEKIAEKLGVRAEFVESKWDSLFAGMDSGRIDIVVNEVEVSEERKEKYDFSVPYTYIHGALLVAADNDEIQGVENLEGKKSAQNLTSSWGQMAESYGAELVGVESMNQSVELILTGRADVTLNAETAFYDFMKNQPDQAVKIAGMTDSTTSSVIPVRKGNSSLVSAIDSALEEMRESGELTELSVKYFGEDVTKQ